MKLEPGAQVTPNVKLLRELGEGGMGAVWVAEHLALGTEVAVKFLQGDYAKDPTARARFSQEAAAASQVKSSHVVKIYDYGLTDTNVPFIVMELLEGTDLAKRIEQERALPPSQLVPIVTQLCKALQAAHDRKVVHRDVKPENVFLSHEGGETFVKLLDFGVAKTSTGTALSSSGRRSTLAGESLGTPYYMSPEQFKSSKSIDYKSDLWSVGVLVYEALTGKLPFEAETVSALAIIVNEAKATPPSQVNAALPGSFDTWFAKACAREPGDRFESARALADALTLAFGTMATAPKPIDSGSYRQVVISHYPPEEMGEVSLRDTSFASTGGAHGSPKSRARVYAIAGLGAACLIGAVAFVATRPPTTASTATASVTHDVPPPSASAPPPAITHDEPVVTATASQEPVTTSTVVVVAQPTKPVHVQPPPSASASAKGRHDRDIW
jgi:serine/threonine-protein kinase